MKFSAAFTTWGINLSNINDWDTEIKTIKENGYEIVELVAAFSFRQNPTVFKEILDKYEMKCIVQLHTSGGIFDSNGYTYIGSTDLNEHLSSFKTLYDEAMELQPILMNVHAGHDSWDDETAIKFLTEASSYGEQKGVKVSFETHRQRLFYNPYSFKRIVSNPSIKGKIAITADLSHWVAVCEHVFSNTESRDKKWWPETLELVAEHTALIHNRVGHEQGPQVHDPRDPKVEYTVNAHLDWWVQIWKNQKKRGFDCTINEMEFGPEPYLGTLPYSGMPVVNQTEVNNAMRDIAKARFDQVYNDV